MSVNVYVAKRALFALLAGETGTGGALEGWQVAYSFPGRDVEDVCIYGGGVRFTQVGVSAEGGVRSEGDTVGVYVRVLRKDSDVAAADVQVETVANAVASVLEDNPHLTGTLSVTGLVGGQGDYANNTDSAVSVLSLQVQVDAFVDG